MTPYLFIVVLWGERYREYFLNWCVASLLSPRNIPALPEGEHRMLIVCPDEDWEWIVTSLPCQRLAEFVRVEHLPFRAPMPDENPCKAMSRGHYLAVQYAMRMRSRGVHLTPDMLWSDGLLENVHHYAEAGAKAVLTVALRFDEGAIRAALAMAKQPIGSVPLAIPHRLMAEVGMHALHPETLSYQWGHPQMSPGPAACWMPVEDGMVIGSFSWAPLLFDYSALEMLDASTLLSWTMDGDYVYRNFDADQVVLLRDTDQGVLLSWSKVDAPTPVWEDYRDRPMTEGQCKAFGKWFNSKALDPFKRRWLWKPVAWHPGPLTPAYGTQAERLLDSIGSALRFDWRRMCYLDAAGQPCGTLDESRDAYETRCRNGR